MSKYGGFEATVSVEVVTEDNSHELIFSITLDCIAPSIAEIPASLSGPGEPEAAPEFEVKGVFLWDETIQYGNRILSITMFRLIVGPEIADELSESAMQQAVESGDF